MQKLRFKGQDYALFSIPGLAIVTWRIIRTICIRVPFYLLIFVLLLMGLLCGFLRREIIED